MKKKLILTLILSMFFGLHSFAQFEINPDDRDEYIEMARQLFRENKWEEGKETTDRGLKKYPKDSDLRELNGRYFLYHEEYDKARYELKKALEYNHKNVSAKQALVNVEMATARYSSAIAYVNELLEVAPYDKGLWLKKAEAFRLQGNIVESNRLLKRIYHIYPEDKVLRSNLIDYLYGEFREKKDSAPLDEVTDLALYIVNEDPQNEDVYIGLINKHLQAGDYEKALIYAEKAVYDMPQNMTILRKRNSILAHLNRYQEILTSLKELMAQSNNPRLRQEYDYFMEEAARHSEQSDYYYNYQMLFQKNPKNMDYFNKVYTAALSRSLFDDATEAIKLAKKENGETKDLLLKELYLNERMGNPSKVKQLTYRINELYPGDEDVTYQICSLYYKEAKDLMADHLYQKALPYLEFIKENGDEEQQRLTLTSQYNCLLELGYLEEAEAVIDTLMSLEPEEADWHFKRSHLHGLKKDYDRALQEYEAGLELTQTKNEFTEWRLIGYDEQAALYTKTLIEAYRLNEALALIDRWLETHPRSESAVRYGYNVSYQLKDVEKMKRYLLHGSEHHPQDLFYRLKLADLYISETDYELASEILLPILEEYPYHKEAIATYSQLSFDKAKQLIKSSEADEGLELLNRALIYDADNVELKYMKGVAFEKLHKLDSAAYYQSFYQPTLVELKDYERHMKYLEFVRKKNEVAFFCHLYRFADVDIITSVAGAEYSRMEEKNTYTGRLFYSGRDNGKGVMGQGEWSHKFSQTFYGTLNASVGSKVFPKFMANLSAYYAFVPTWEAELTIGFRNLVDSKKMYNQQIGASKEFDFARFTAKFNSVILDKDWYYNVFAQSRFYIRDHRNYVTGMASVGSAPDIEVIDKHLYDAFNVTNTMVGVGGHFIISRACSIDAMGLWYHYKAEKDLYKNIYSLQLKLNIRF